MTPETLITWRQKRGWSRAEAARRCHVHRNSWRNWELARTTPPPWLPLVMLGVELELSGMTLKE